MITCDDCGAPLDAEEANKGFCEECQIVQQVITDLDLFESGVHTIEDFPEFYNYDEDFDYDNGRDS